MLAIGAALAIILGGSGAAQTEIGCSGRRWGNTFRPSSGESRMQHNDSLDHPTTKLWSLIVVPPSYLH